MGVWTIPGGWVELRPLTGRDERSVEGTSVLDVVALIDRVAVARPGAAFVPGAAMTLTSAVRDRVLALIYRQNYGDVVTSSPHCTVCGERYDLSFSLSDLLKEHPIGMPPADGVYRTAAGVRFRLPAGVDELAVIGLAPEAARRELLKRCTLGDDDTPAAIEAAMEAVAPLLTLELQAICPECGATQTLEFDIGTYLLRRLLGDKERLPHEVHTLAMAYGWGHDDILNLTRVERRRYIALIEASVRESRARSSGGSRRRLG